MLLFAFNIIKMGIFQSLFLYPKKIMKLKQLIGYKLVFHMNLNLQKELLLFNCRVMELQKIEFLSKKKPQASTSSLTPGRNIYLQDTVNVRESMSENSARIGVAYAGETLTIVQVYNQGWTKVNWKGQVGYVRSDVLQAM